MSLRSVATTLCIIQSLLSIEVHAQSTVLKAGRLFDGFEMHDRWIVAFEEDRITYVGRDRDFAGATVLDLGGDATILPGLIEGHSHILLHPYDETNWNDQVLKESPGERAARATVHVRKSLEAGITTMRDLGSEGAGYLDVGIKQAIEKGVIPGPRLIVAGPAIVATGSYGPKGFHEYVDVPLGAEEADAGNLITVVRRQIGHGADFIKVYADYRWGPDGSAQPTFSQAEIATIVETAKSSGRVTVAHAATEEGIRRAVMAGVSTIEHGDALNKDLAQLMAEKEVALYPTLAAVESISRYRGWNKGQGPEPLRVTQKKQAFKTALDAGVIVGFGGDVGVYTHGTNVIELELMVEYGMSELQALKAATSLNASVFELNDLGTLTKDKLADIVVVRGDPSQEISALRDILMVIKNGEIAIQK